MPVQPAHTPRFPRHWRGLLRRSLAFAALGPLVGGSLIATAMTLVSWPDDGAAALMKLTLLPVMLVVAYPVGLLPAALAGLLHALFCPVPTGTARTLALAALSGALTVGAAMALLIGLMDPGSLLSMQGWPTLALALGFGGICAVLTHTLLRGLARRWQRATAAPRD